ncbi:hypothetical protein [Nocardia iowensis]|uniref:Uncharacterized protein n=1 Tax=Nocardia iowensis TaxID=204891 RepID=A0ABX8RWW3_NOCIO|nr:hypothetical protein [Nocardia iowensis]QXN94143.1 hypothetical protein KV110_14410 [Nocardia iowensis]
MSEFSDRGKLLTYLVEISEADRFSPLWWQVSNSGGAAQVAAALIEMAVRLELELPYDPTDFRCWYRYEVRWPDGAILEGFEGAVEPRLIPDDLRALARSVISVTVRDLRRRNG